MNETKACLSELLRPWKLLTLVLRIGFLIAGSYYYVAPDWDVPISLIMAILAYLTSSWSMRVLIERRWRYLLATHAVLYLVYGRWMLRTLLALQNSCSSGINAQCKSSGFSLAVQYQRNHLAIQGEPVRIFC